MVRSAGAGVVPKVPISSCRSTLLDAQRMRSGESASAGGWPDTPQAGRFCRAQAQLLGRIFLMLFCSEKLLTFSGFTQPDSSMFARVCRTRSIGVLHASTFAGACDRGQRILRSLRRPESSDLELISNNLANLNTAGYSSSQVDKRKVGKLATAIQVAFQQMGFFPVRMGHCRQSTFQWRARGNRAR